MLLNEIALHLCLVVAPLCILAYIYEPTRFLFVNWLKFTIATLFSMVIISVVTVIALRAILVLIASLLAMDVGNGIANALGVNASLQLRDIATLSGGVGMLLTMLLLSAPSLIYNFFSGQVSTGFQGYNLLSNAAMRSGGDKRIYSMSTIGNSIMPIDKVVKKSQTIGGV